MALRTRVTTRCQRLKPIEEIDRRRRRDRQRFPAQLRRRQGTFTARRGAQTVVRHTLEAYAVAHRGQDSVEPRPAIGLSGRSERASADLLCVEAERGPLRRITADGQRPRLGFRRVRVSESRLIAKFGKGLVYPAAYEGSFSQRHDFYLDVSSGDLTAVGPLGTSLFCPRLVPRHAPSRDSAKGHVRLARRGEHQ